MRERIWIAFAALAGVLFAVQVMLPVDQSERPETTYETAPRGHAALFELLQRFDLTHGRWMSGVSMPDVGETLWWIAPRGVCDAAARDRIGADEVAQTETDPRRETQFTRSVRPWIETGGTAVVWLAHPPMTAFEPRGEREQQPSESDFMEVVYRPDLERAASESDAGPKSQRGSEEETEKSGAGRADGDEREDPEAVREGWQETLEDARQERREGEAVACDGIAGFELPSRYWAGLEGDAVPVDAAFAAIAFSVGRFAENSDDFDYSAARTVPGATLAFFDPPRDGPMSRSDSDSNRPLRPRSDGWTPVWVRANDFAPYVLERNVGDGRLIVVADARILTNARLARGDVAPLVVDFVEEWGVPWIDEHLHGVVPESGLFRVLARSAAAPVFLGVLFVGLFVLWRGQAWPKRDVDELDPETPTIATFVRSLAHLYSQTGDYPEAFERYRTLSIERVRRALGLAPGVSGEQILAVLRAHSGGGQNAVEAGLRDLLRDATRVEDQETFERAVERLDGLVDAMRSVQRGAIDESARGAETA